MQGITGVVDNSSKNGVDMIIASTSADSKVRAIAVKKLVFTLSDQDLNPSSQVHIVKILIVYFTSNGFLCQGSIHSALLARVLDTDQGVVDALYEQPTTITPVLVAHSQTYLENVSNSLTAAGSKPKRSLLRAHLTFISCRQVPPKLTAFSTRSCFPSCYFRNLGNIPPKSFGTSSQPSYKNLTAPKVQRMNGLRAAPL